MVITIHLERQESKENDNGGEKSPVDNMSLYSETNSDNMVEKEEILAPAPSNTDQERELLFLPSLHKTANPYRLLIPLTCCPQKADNDKKPLKLKNPRSFMVNMTIGGKKMTQAMLDLGPSANIIPYSVYLRQGLGNLQLAP